MNTPLRYMKANGTKNEKIESLPRSELDHLLSNFFLKARRKNGKEYEPASVFSFQHSIQRYLSEKKYPFNMLKDNGFEKIQKSPCSDAKVTCVHEHGEAANRKLLRPSTKTKRMPVLKQENLANPIQLRCGGFYPYTSVSEQEKTSVKQSVTVFHRSSFNRCKRRIHQPVHIISKYFMVMWKLTRMKGSVELLSRAMRTIDFDWLFFVNFVQFWSFTAPNFHLTLLHPYVVKRNNQENIVWSTKNPFSNFGINNCFCQIPLQTISHSINLFFKLVVACFRLSCLRHQEYATAEPL